MKTAMKILVSLIVFVILVISALFRYSKIKENENLKKQLSEKQSNHTNMDTTSSQQTENATEQTTNEKNNNESENEIPNTKVTRDNVFDYVIKEINDSGDDASLIRFQEPTYEANSDRWFIVANNKSGVGTTYKIYVDNTGHVTIYEGVNDNVVVNDDVSLN
ncbi:hypothetical protein [Staphylococcus epidermidis]|uniref:hypothetical protein n=1 Tax=Staphylococcus epidermidis TaxID=1282 RepID=UPI0036D352B7